jgi:Uma2 family endonuclease
MPPPLLVVEVVSPGEIQRDRDYIAKRMQYQDLGVPEYWIVDPQEGNIVVRELSGTVYSEVKTFRGDKQVRSPQLGELNATVAQILPESINEE